MYTPTRRECRRISLYIYIYIYMFQIPAPLAPLFHRSSCLGVGGRGQGSWDLGVSSAQLSEDDTDAMQCNAMQGNARQCNAMQRNAMQCNGMQCNAMQCNSIQFNAMQCNAIHNPTGPHGHRTTGPQDHRATGPQGGRGARPHPRTSTPPGGRGGGRRRAGTYIGGIPGSGPSLAGSFPRHGSWKQSCHFVTSWFPVPHRVLREVSRGRFWELFEKCFGMLVGESDRVRMSRVQKFFSA